MGHPEWGTSGGALVQKGAVTVAASKKMSGATLWLSIVLLTGTNASAQRPAGAEPPGGVQPVNKEGGPTVVTTNDTAQQQPVSKQENKAIKAFRDAPSSDADKKTQLGEEFIQTYPQSRYRPEVINWLASVYLTKGQVDKLTAAGDKEMALTETNPVSLAVLGSNLARALNANTPGLQQHLDQAEGYCKKALDDLTTSKKRADMSDSKFEQAKNQTSAVAYSGLGVVNFRKGNYKQAIANLEQAVKLGGGADPVDYYILGKANEAETNYDQALAAYTKCAAMQGGMQAACQSSIQDVKAHGAMLPK
jgi:tetratricopeptide (TPR) repeat protein